MVVGVASLTLDLSGEMWHNLVMIPRHLQGVLWGMPVDKLDVDRDAGYIIHSVLIYGTLAQLRWLYSTYGKDRIKNEFVNRPQKIYPSQAYNFAKKILFDLPESVAPREKYDQTVPRRVG